MRLLLLLAALFVSCAPRVPSPSSAAAPEVLVFAWTSMPFDFRTSSEAEAYRDAGVFKRAPLAGVEVDREGNVYVTTPRWLDARVPSTLSRVVTVNGQPVLRPFPTWEQNALGRPDAFQNVLGLEVDSQDRMWVLDMGWVAGVDGVPDGAQKLVVIDLRTGAELRRYAIPDSVADRRTSFLNDLAIDEARELAYLSDSGNRAGAPTASGIIVYDFKANSARRVLDRDPAVTDDPARTLVVDGEPVFASGRLAVGLNGIALSPDGETLWWSITTGDALYRAPTAILRDPSASPQRLAAAVAGPRRIGGGSDGLTVDARGRVYVTNLARNAVEVLDPATDTLTTLAGGPDFVWPDSLSWDDRGGLYVSTNRLHHAFSGRLSYDGPAPNFRIFRIPTDSSKGFVLPQAQTPKGNR
ncbi:MAG: SMP-30/gluconolactonase/LRE family protein [Myxococcaceae bacterium]|jgi:sugar lactone lactonase YvrE|nr:SMP-30/gluconolactonase/LRE family protein [Myxococcaceae bacterium]MCA3012006.1 SMP-30/gluconolactonase/LRE family protein [Myxococcaceae bacterium]